MDAVEYYARSWARTEGVDHNILSEWTKTVRNLVKRRVYILHNSMATRYRSVFNDTDVSATLSDIHDKFVVVPADKASNNVVFVCKKYYIQCLINELGIAAGGDDNDTYHRTAFSKEDILSNHESVISSFGIPSNNHKNCPFLYWIPKLHKNPYKQRFIAGSSSCSTKPLSKLLTTILTTIKDGLQRYSDVVYYRNGVNSMWILKNSKDLVEQLGSQYISGVSSIRT